MASMMGGMMGGQGMEGIQKMMGGLMGGGKGGAPAAGGPVSMPGRATIGGASAPAPSAMSKQDAAIAKKAAVDQTVEDVAKMQALTQNSMGMSPFQDMSMYAERHLTDPQQQAMMAQKNSKADELQKMLMRQYSGRGLI